MKVKVELPLDTKAILRMDQIIDSWRASPGEDAEMRKCYTQDRKDLRRVLTLYKRGSWKQAADFADSLDTLVREMIPDPIWDSIQSTNSYEE